MITTTNTKLEIKVTSLFKKQFKKIVKQGKDINKFIRVVEKLANNEELDLKHKNHYLFDNKIYHGCRECHIEPDWLLIYQIHEKELILLLVATGSHSNLF